MPPTRKTQGLPLPSSAAPAPIVRPRATISMIAVSTLNDRARLSCRRSFAAMGWPPGHPIVYSTHDHLIAIRSARGRPSRFKIGARGQIWLPAQLLRATRLEPGDSVVIVTLPPHSALAIIPTPLVQDALVTIVADLIGAS